MYVLDTSTCISIMRNEPAAAANFASVFANCVVTSVVVFELMTGIEKCQSPATERPKVVRFLRVLRELPFDNAAASKAAKLRSDLESIGQGIGVCDTLIAGHCLALRATLVTKNVKEFQRVTGLTVATW